ncbi:hypothetical protein Q9306_03995 [Bacillus sp. WLY-B-L8]|nr:hypothetical protein [Bacillus sp. WLY-B-L8]
MNLRDLVKNIHRAIWVADVQRLCRNEVIILLVTSLIYIRANNKKKIGGI